MFRDLAEDSAAKSLIGLLPTDMMSRGLQQITAPIGVYDRYLRRGIQATLDETAPEQYRALARCADDLIAEFDAEVTLETILRPEYKNSAILDDLLVALEKLLQKRGHMTLCESEDEKFDEVVYAAIRYHMDQAQRMLRRPPGVHEHRYLVYAEKAISKVLAPWFNFRLLETRGGRIVIYLRSLLTRRLVEDAHTAEFGTIADYVTRCYEACAISALDDFLEYVRGTVLDGSWLPAPIFWLAQPFKRYLESGGDPILMPIVQRGDREARELTKLGLYKSGRMKCKPDCPCPLPRVVEELEEILQARLSPEKSSEREAIMDFFALNEELPQLGGLGAAFSRERLELSERVCLKE